MSGASDVRAVAIDAAGDVFATGSITYNPSQRFPCLKVDGDTGALLWHATAPPVVAGNVGQAIAVAPDGDVVVAGSNNGLSAKRYDGATGATSDWSHMPGISGGYRRIDVDENGDVLLTGSRSVSSTAFVHARKLAGATGTSTWAVDLHSSTSTEEGHAVLSNGAGQVYVAGTIFTTPPNRTEMTGFKLKSSDGTHFGCGDGTAGAGEECEDGNFVNGDCCDSFCQLDAAGTVCRASLGECDPAESCNGVTTGCPADTLSPAGTACTADTNVCTTDACNGAGACTHPNSPPATPCTSDGNACTDDQCNGSGSCTHPNNSAPCSDGLFCNGADTCGGGTCSQHAGTPCTGGECADLCNEALDTCFDAPGTTCTDDGNVCTNDQCDGAGACAHPNNAAPCSDGLFCNGSDTCGGGSCSVHTGDPCSSGPECADACNETADDCLDPASTPCTDDGNACTTDQCNGAGACGHAPGNEGGACSDDDTCTSGETCSGGTCDGGATVTCPLCQTCDTLGGCLEAPRTGCKVPTLPGKSVLILQDRTPNTLDQVKWKWGRGQATTFPEFGNPAATDDYALCLFDGTNELLMQMTAPAGGTCGTKPCWQQSGGAIPKGYKYKDADGLPHDLDLMTLKTGAEGKAKIGVKGKGDSIPMPPLGTALTLPLRVQLQSESGACFEAVYSSGVTTNTGQQLKAKSE